MSNNQNASFSDLTRARALSRKIAGLDTDAVERPKYVQLGGPMAAPPPSPPVAPPPAAAPPPVAAPVPEQPQTSRRVAVPPAPSVAETPPVVSPEAAASAVSSAAAASEAPRTSSDAGGVASPVRFGPAQWESFLRWAVGLVKGESAALMDGSGLLVASWGGGQDLEATGARMMLMFEQAGAIDSLVRSVTVGLPRSTITGVHFLSDTRQLTLVLLSNQEIPMAGVHEVDEAFAEFVEVQG